MPFRVAKRRFENGKIPLRLHSERLQAPLHWKRPRRVFVNSLSDLFHEDVPDEFVDRVFASMALAPVHQFQVLTKRPERMRAYIESRSRPSQAAALDMAARRIGHTLEFGGRQLYDWPLRNVWLGVSAEDQQRADERIPLLLQTPAAVRFLSCEPLLGPVDLTAPRGTMGDDGGRVLRQAFGEVRELWACPVCQGARYHETDPVAITCGACRGTGSGIGWCIAGGESGPGARPCNVAWLRAIVAQCRSAGVPCFVKQLGSRPVERVEVPAGKATWDCGVNHTTLSHAGIVHEREGWLRDRKGGDPAEWPDDLRVRQWPAQGATA